MRRIVILLIVFATVISGCNSDGAQRGALDSVTTTSSSSTTSSTTTTTSSTTTTSTTTTTTSTTTTTTVPSTLPVPRNSPMEYLDSYTGTTDFVMDLGEGLEIGVTVDSVYVGEAYSCEVTTFFASISLVNLLVVTPDTIWYDDGDGIREYDFPNQQIRDLNGMCAGAPDLWQDFYDPILGALDGEEEEYEGLAALRIDLLAESELASALGFLPGDMEIEEFTMWVADPQRWPMRLRMAAVIGPEAFADMLGTAPSDASGSLSMEIALADFDDPTLTVDVPGVGPVGPGA